MKQPAVYIMANKPNGTLYTGVTSDLPKRVYEHKNGIKSEFTSQYKCHSLVYFAVYEDMEAAISEEKRIKAGSRKQKLYLIENMNPAWDDLYQSIL